MSAKKFTKIDSSTEIKPIHWSNIIFSDGSLQIFHSGQWYTIKDIRSRKVFNYLKNHLSIFENIAVNTTLDTVSFRGLDVMQHVFDRLEIEVLLGNDDLGKIIHWGMQNKQWNNINIINAFRLKDKSDYFDFLCRIYDGAGKIIPVREKRLSSSGSYSVEEDAFIFPYKKSVHSMFFLWESVEESRATHIFKCKYENSDEALQKVFDYVSSPLITNKREKLHSRSIEFFANGVAKYIGSVNHSEFEAWRVKIIQMCI